MKHIWAPWRVAYIRAEKPKGCILCDKPAGKNDVENHILFRGNLSYVMLNAYPYNPGHLMVVPYRHISNMEEMTAAERNEHYAIVSQCLKALKEEFKPQGVNIGMNLGKVAGAGIDDHIHTHVIPRWNGDTNFITTVADARVVPEALADTYRKLKERF